MNGRWVHDEAYISIIAGRNLLSMMDGCYVSQVLRQTSFFRAVLSGATAWNLILPVASRTASRSAIEKIVLAL